MTNLKVYRTHENVTLPEFSTAQSACFDLAMNDAGKQVYHGFSVRNAPIQRPCGGVAVIGPGDRMVIPTGLIFDIPEGYSIRVHPRSGLSLKSGLILANCEGVIDADYFEELYVMLHNTSQNAITIKNGDRIAQAELVKVEMYKIVDTDEAPVQKTDRVGGLGSTGVTGPVVRQGNYNPETHWPNGRKKYGKEVKKEFLPSPGVSIMETDH